ncbi:hypothetical protein [Actinacidiphila rubida]|uniref:Uncharacterized protein n=1 Tax=Actinacidiphila rubida TaxID=310780 RepID=A0A1H8S5N8_9ACTN|nr:hypothetical protein [Actinacidiphila rubida]SEO74000.1 hypothetical protein SAMN05216267_103969 [Actinacidiphila rubida]
MGGLAAGLIYGADLWAGHQRPDTGKEGTIRWAFFGPAATALRALAAFAVPVAVGVLLVSGSALCVALVVFRENHYPCELPAEGSDRKQPTG